MPNHLVHSSSLYLRQHANQAIDWFSWSEQALQIAKTTDKPIFLSIGYSSCHWCHVMAEQVFTDDAVATFLNTHFVSIKVDREQRPDLDKVYMNCHQLLTGHQGGWPLTLFLDPRDLLPFYSGTFFPQRAQHGLPAFIDLLTQVNAFFHEHRETVHSQAKRLQKALTQSALPTAYTEGELFTALNIEARDYLAKVFDGQSGGFGEAPKFSHPFALLSLLDSYRQQPTSVGQDELALAMVEKTLHHMGQGGLQDHVGGGFFRYSVDASWQIPHFEKMLYDQANLLTIYSYAFWITRKTWYHVVATKIHDFVQETFYIRAKGYAAAQDADSEGEEGRYYRWSLEDLNGVLTPEEVTWFMQHLNLAAVDSHEAGHIRWQEQASNDWINTHTVLPEPYITYEKIMNKLKQARLKRSLPLVDAKVLTGWNGIYLAALFRASLFLEEFSWGQEAFKVLDIIYTRLWHDDYLLAYQEHDEKQAGFLEDYAYLLDAVLYALQYQFRTQDWHMAIKLAEIIIKQFYCPKTHLFYITSLTHHESLIQRPHQEMDDVLPSAAGVAISCLLRLGQWAKRPQWLSIAESALRAVWSQVQHNPAYYYQYRLAARWLNQRPLLIIRGEAQQVSLWQQALQRKISDNCTILAIADSDDLPSLFSAYQAEGDVSAWYCDETNCYLPFTDLAVLSHKLTGESK